MNNGEHYNVKKDIFSKEHINVVASGRIMYQKGFDILIQAFNQVYIKNKKYRLYIIGGDYVNLQEKYQITIDELKLHDIIHFLGFQKNPYIYYKQADLFVMSSRWEGLPNTILENLYLKRPIVATNCIPFMQTLIQDGQNGFLVESQNVQMLAEAILKYNTLTKLGNLSYLQDTNINDFFKKNHQKLKATESV